MINDGLLSPASPKETNQNKIKFANFETYDQRNQLWINNDDLTDFISEVSKITSSWHKKTQSNILHSQLSPSTWLKEIISVD